MNESQKMTWNNANDQCRSYGGQLVSIHSPDENMMIMSRTVISNTGSFWIGLRVSFFNLNATQSYCKVLENLKASFLVL